MSRSRHGRTHDRRRRPSLFHRYVGIRCRAHERHCHSHAVPSAKRDARGRLPRVRGGAGGRVLTASCVRPAGIGHGREHASEKVRAREGRCGDVDVRSSLPCARQQHSGDCELETLASASVVAAPLSATDHEPRERRVVAKHRRGFRRLYPLRSLHSRMQRNSPQLRAGPHGQGRHGGNRI